LFERGKAQIEKYITNRVSNGFDHLYNSLPREKEALAYSIKQRTLLKKKFDFKVQKQL